MLVQEEGLPVVVLERPDLCFTLDERQQHTWRGGVGCGSGVWEWGVTVGCGSGGAGCGSAAAALAAALARGRAATRVGEEAKGKSEVVWCRWVSYL